MNKNKSKFISVCVVLMLTLAACGTNTTTNNTSKTTTGTAATKEDTKEEEKEETKTIKYETELESGNYTVGVDIPSGSYNIEVVKGNGNVISDDGNINLMMGTDSDDMYIKNYKNAKLKDGLILAVSAVKIKITSDAASGEALEERKQDITEEVTLDSGNYVAGEDFAAGTYNIEVVKGNGNVSSDNMFDGGLNSIMGTDSDDMYEKEYKNVSLPEGISLSVEGVTVKLVPSK